MLQSTIGNRYDKYDFRDYLKLCIEIAAFFFFFYQEKWLRWSYLKWNAWYDITKSSRGGAKSSLHNSSHKSVSCHEGGPGIKSSPKL